MSEFLRGFTDSSNRLLFGSIDTVLESLPMPHYFIHAVIETVHMIPFLLVIFILVELMERRFGKNVQHGIERAAAAGPLLGALFGCLPQCGFSIIATALFTRRIITLGTLMAVYLSTSDEAIPVILSKPDKAHLVFALLLTKFAIAVTAGYLIDLINTAKPPLLVDTKEELDASEDHGCCNHTITGYRDILKSLLHTVIHTAKIVFFVFIVTLGINYLVHWAGGGERLGSMLMSGSFVQPLITAVFGLIPNCAASVAITLAYLNGGISFGSVIAGLSSSAGLGMLVMIRENHDRKQVLKIAGLLVAISTVAGILLQIFELM